MHINIHALLHHYGYAGVFVVLMLEMIGIPFPAETTLTLAGIAWTQGVFSLIPLLLAAAGGHTVGAGIAYLIGRFLGRPVVTRYGRYVGITAARLTRAETTFAKYQASVLLFSKFIAGIRVLVPYIAGINRMRPLWFLVYTVVGAAVWAAVFIVLGKYIGRAWLHYHALLSHYVWQLGVGLVVLAAIYVGWKVWRRRHRQVSG
ncbi:MAG: DedA family protein [Alicyclobacillus sp.]|nr:DedA family protein [Alicyclobacillus sp.]